MERSARASFPLGYVLFQYDYPQYQVDLLHLPEDPSKPLEELKFVKL